MRMLASLLFFFGGVIHTYSQDLSYAQLQHIADYTNKHLQPFQSDLIRMDSVYALAEDTLVYLATILKANRNTPAMKEFKQKFEPMLIKKLVEDRKIRDLLHAKIIFLYKFYFSNKEYFFSIFITPDKYLNLLP